MKTLVISDLHFTNRFQQKRYDFLKQLIENSSQVIINGDLFSDHTVTFDDFFQSEWSRLFPLLKKKGCIYIFGNHDKEHFSDERRKQFAVESNEGMDLVTKAGRFRIEHGHHLLNKHWQEPERLTQIKRKTGVMNYSEPLLDKVVTKRGVALYKVFGAGWQRRLKKYAKHKLIDADFLVVGHTHIPEYSPENKFINTGFINFGHAYWLEITDKTAELKEARY